MAARRSNKTLRTILVVLMLLAALALALFILTYEPAPPTEPPVQITETETDGVRLVTWNLYNFGRSKDDQEMAFIAEVLRDYDLVAIQEVSTGPAGAQAVARLDDELDRTGATWDYVVSDPTTGDGSERYAYLWKPSRVRLLGRGWLEASLADPIDREPYLARFASQSTGQQMLLASFHAVPTSKDPEREIVLLDELHRRYPEDHVLIMGDFNLAQDDEAFDELKALGYIPILVEQRTSLKRQRKDGEHLASEYDNIFFEVEPLRADTSGIIDFTTQFTTLKQARTISDHVPVFMDVQWN